MFESVTTTKVFAVSDWIFDKTKALAAIEVKPLREITRVPRFISSRRRFNSFDVSAAKFIVNVGTPAPSQANVV
ncbi:MAG TPA: hypothetical protein PKY59_18625 [Pyrinomonadaceae bacterium]|nr:hypothetical protein [Pyrinomonadaceae bacterium]